MTFRIFNFQESEIVEQIDRDVKRTHPEMPFFSSDTSLAKSNQVSTYVYSRMHLLLFDMVTLEPAKLSIY